MKLSFLLVSATLGAYLTHHYLYSYKSLLKVINSSAKELILSEFITLNKDL